MRNIGWHALRKEARMFLAIFSDELRDGPRASTNARNGPPRHVHAESVVLSVMVDGNYTGVRPT